jgi:hypothetical protein
LASRVVDLKEEGMSAFNFVCFALIVAALAVAFDLLVERRGEK